MQESKQTFFMIFLKNQTFSNFIEFFEKYILMLLFFWERHNFQNGFEIFEKAKRREEKRREEKTREETREKRQVPIIGGGGGLGLWSLHGGTCAQRGCS